MEELSLTPVMKPIDLQSLKDTFDMKLTEIEFENRFSNLFHEELPPPLAKTVGQFIYPAQHKRSCKRQAPVPPKPRHNEGGINNYHLKTLKELGPILAQSATLPPNASYRVEVSVKSTTTQRSPTHKTISSKTSLVSVFKLRQTSSLQLRKRTTFRKAMRRKNRSFGDLFNIGNPTDRGEPEGKKGSPKNTALSPLQENTNSSHLNVDPNENQEILPDIKENQYSLEESLITANVKNSPRVKDSFSSMQFSPSGKQGNCSLPLDSPSDMNIEIKGILANAHDRQTQLHTSSPCKQNSPSMVHDGSSPEQGTLSSDQGSPSNMLHINSQEKHILSLVHECPSDQQGKDSMPQAKPFHMHVSPVCTRDTRSHSHDSKCNSGRSCSYDRPPNLNICFPYEKCKHIAQEGPDNMLPRPLTRQKNASPKSNPTSMQDSPFPIHGSPSPTQNHISTAQNNLSYVQGSSCRGQSNPNDAWCSPSHAQCNSSGAQCSPCSAHCSSPRAKCNQPLVKHRPSCVVDSPYSQNKISREQCNPSFTESSSCSSYVMPSQMRGGPSLVQEVNFDDRSSIVCLSSSPSCATDSPLHVWSSSSRMRGYSSFHQNSSIKIQRRQSIINLCSPLLESVGTRKHASPSEVNAAGTPITSASASKTKISHYSNSTTLINIAPQEKENEKANDLNYTSYYRKKLSCDHIYEEIEECLSQNGIVLPSPSPQPVSSNSQSISPKHQTNIDENMKYHSEKKNPPPKPPRNRKGILQEKGSLPFDVFSKIQQTDTSQESGEHKDVLNVTENGFITPNRNDDNLSDAEGLIQVSGTDARPLKSYYFGDSEITPGQPNLRRSLSKKSKKFIRGTVVSTRSPRKCSFKAKMKNKNAKRKFSFPNTFRFSLKTSFGNIRLFGEKAASKWPSKSTRKFVNSRKFEKSPAQSTLQNFSIPRIVIHLESSDEESDGISDILNSTERKQKQSKDPSPVPSLITQLKDYEGCDLSVMESPNDFHTPLSSMDLEGNDYDDVECIEVVSKPEKPRNCSKPMLMDKNSNDVIYINTVTNVEKLNQSCKAHSCPNVNFLEGEQDEEVTILGISESTCHQIDSGTTHLKDSNFSMNHSKYFRSYDDLLVILNSD